MEVIKINSFEECEGLEGCYVQRPQDRVPIYIPKRDENGVAILPKDWDDGDDWSE